ncbi:response regulator [Dyadobacter psychrotolerans]|uniref:Response regulator n=1 Tax=Dyadobacter psychrotolerans TaxID=2541721 RepID=A0A4R5DMW2_9BACT|nr:response regulator [Dyadobacter psychrotolerans]TDE14867.1 response regulator [Dyadobacter psychrotolerans]
MRKEIYFVDDSEDQRSIVRSIFGYYLRKHTIRFFESGEALYRHMVNISDEGYHGPIPGLILLDLHMPGIDGKSLLRLIRQSPSARIDWKTLPAVVFTSLATKAQLDACYKAGANSVLIKQNKIEDFTSQLRLICNYWLDENKLHFDIKP